MKLKDMTKGDWLDVIAHPMGIVYPITVLIAMMSIILTSLKDNTIWFGILNIFFICVVNWAFFKRYKFVKKVIK